MKPYPRPLLLMHSQRGATLFITTIMMLLLTILALGAMSLNSMQTRIATNAADAQIAFQTAEGALNQAQTNIIAGNYPPGTFVANSNGLYTFAPASAPLWTTVNWSSSSAAIQSFTGNSSAPAAYIIEQLPSVIRPGQNYKKQTQVFRVTVRAVGASGGAPVMLQSTVQIQQ
ncbi:MAG: PilX N-terminal domain-containing pilus assembly protein [Collimonas sp.]|uniref:pilus assembly PilX family protein n=1 Tax=Collimonas sp. TaxID=1963772 RepID=UPI00326339BE